MIIIITIKSLKQKKRKFEPRIKLNHNISIVTTFQNFSYNYCTVVIYHI